MSAIDATRLRMLGRRLDVEPRQLALALIRLARNSEASATERIEYLRDQAFGAAATDLLLTPVTDFGHDAVDRAFAGIWPPLAGD